MGECQTGTLWPIALIFNKNSGIMTPRSSNAGARLGQLYNQLYLLPGHRRGHLSIFWESKPYAK